jgi:hypothetical protein
VNSCFHLCERGYHQDRVDVDALTADIADVDEDLVALYSGSILQRLFVLDLRIVHVFV